MSATILLNLKSSPEIQKHLQLAHPMPGLPWWLSGKEMTCNAGDTASIPGSGRSPGVGNGNPLQYSWEIPWTEEPGGVQSMGSQKSLAQLKD